MRLHNLEVTFHRTVRVAEGRVPSNLPPSLGRIKLYKVSDYRKNCPEYWDNGSYFLSLHDTEAMWIAFQSIGKPCAVLVGAGGVNALTGGKLGTKLEKDNYLVCPPQPWLDGWKDVDGTVHQFVATPHKKGDGITVGEQMLGAESQTGAMGLAIFEPKEDAKLTVTPVPVQGYVGTAACTNVICPAPPTLPRQRPARPHAEMGLGKGGKIIQKVYSDPHGLTVWKAKPTVVFAFYLVDAKTAEDITGETVANPVAHSGYNGPWFGLQDEKLPDVAGTNIFSGLKSAFPGDTTNAQEEAVHPEQLPIGSKTGA